MVILLVAVAVRVLSQVLLMQVAQVVAELALLITQQEQQVPQIQVQVAVVVGTLTQLLVLVAMAADPELAARVARMALQVATALSDAWAALAVAAAQAADRQPRRNRVVRAWVVRMAVHQPAYRMVVVVVEVGALVRLDQRPMVPRRLRIVAGAVAVADLMSAMLAALVAPATVSCFGWRDG